MEHNMQCVFVNTEQQPLKIKRLNIFEYSIVDGKMRVNELCEYFYPHPQAPENAIVSVYRWTEVEYIKGTDSLIKQAIDAVTAIGKITKLPE
jgi:hypothetical protein